MTKEEKKLLRTKKREERRKKGIGFFEEFKKFITRGNVLDMAVGVIVASAFTKIVTTLNAKIITPLINWLIGSNTVGTIKTILRKEILDLEGNIVQSEIALIWSDLIQAILDFILIAFIIFIIIKFINNFKTKVEKAKMKAKMLLLKEKIEKHEEIEEVQLEEKKEEKPTVEDLLTEIRDLIKSSKQGEKNVQDDCH